MSMGAAWIPGRAPLARNDGFVMVGMSKAKMENRAKPKRFYATVAVQQDEAGWRIALDGRVLKTPAKHPLVLRNKTLAHAMAAEWDAQETWIDADAMPLMRLASITIDRVPQDRAALIDEIVRYAGTDLTCYLAPATEELGRRQRAAFTPLLEWAQQAHGLHFITTESIMPIAQPAATLHQLRLLVARANDAELAALALMVPLLGSAVIALALWQAHLSVEQALPMARLDEAYHDEQWGADAEAAASWAGKARDIRAAAEFLQHVGDWHANACEQKA